MVDLMEHPYTPATPQDVTEFWKDVSTAEFGTTYSQPDLTEAAQVASQRVIDAGKAFHLVEDPEAISTVGRNN